jgi:MoaA/NifB/PqqE/SkfB family radical SAM enzyme
MDISFVYRLIDFIKTNKIKVSTISITGGEPLLHPRLYEIIKGLTKISKNIGLNTNATLLSKGQAQELINTGISKFKIGIDDLTLHDYLSMKMNDTEEFKELIKFIASVSDLQLNVVITKSNLKNVEQILRFAQDNNVQWLNFIELSEFNFQDSDRIEKERCDFDIFVKGVISAGAEIIKIFPTRTIAKIRKLNIKLSKDFCRLGKCDDSYSVITADERLILCNKKPSFIKLDFSNDIFAKIQRGRKTQKTQCEHKKRK